MATSPRIRRLLSQAHDLAEQNRFAAAEQIYRDIVEESPNAVDGWLGLARMVRNDGEREQLFLRVLEIDPGNQEAKHGLHGDVMTVWDNAAEAIDTIESDILKEAKPELNGVADIVIDGVQVEEEVDAEVGLRCNKCGKGITAKNSKHTPVGYRCNDCIREIEETYFSAEAWHYVVASLVALVLATGASFIVGRSNFGLIALLIGGGVGSVIGRLAFRAAGRNRGRYLPLAISLMIVLGALGVWVLVDGNIISLLLFVVLATTAAYYQLR